MSNFFENLSRIAETVNNAATFIQGIKNDAIGSDIANRVSNSILKSKSSNPPADPETSSTMVTLNPSVENRVPVLYGTGFSKGIIVDAALDPDGESIWLSYVLSERTGTTIAGVQSEITLDGVLLDGYAARFDVDGIHIKDRRDSQGNIDSSIDGLIEVYFYNNGSEEYRSPLGYDPLDSTVFFAYNLFPGWGSAHRYWNFVFAICKITYSQEKDLTRLPEFTFKLRNTMDNPGDVLYDYLTSTRYGAGVPESEIRST
jgi:hypothetical protein